MHKGTAANVGGLCSVFHTGDDAKALGDSGAGSSSLEGDGIDVQSVRSNLTLFFLRLPSFSLFSPRSQLYHTSSVLFAAFVKLSVKLSAGSFLGSSNQKRTETFSGRGVHTAVLSILQQERPQKLSSSLWVIHSQNRNNPLELCVLPGWIYIKPHS